MLSPDTLTAVVRAPASRRHTADASPKSAPAQRQIMITAFNDEGELIDTHRECVDG